MGHGHTAMSGLSANVYSCGGEGSLFRGGEDGTLAAGAISSLGTLVKNLRIPFLGPRSDSESEGGGGESDESDDKSERSSFAILSGGGQPIVQFVACTPMCLLREGALKRWRLLLQEWK
jgi:hypothetical protein